MKLEDAIVAATRIHAGQVDKGGAPYIEHALRVMLAVQGEREKIAAVLHDAAEDAGWTRLEAELGELPPPWLRDALDALTRRPDEPYGRYLERVRGNPTAVAVKLADLADNMNLSRIPNPTSEDRERVEKYETARRVLVDAQRAARFGWREGDFTIE